MIRKPRIAIIVAFISITLLAASPAIAMRQSAQPSTSPIATQQSQGASAAPTAAPSIPIYPDTLSGLEKLMKDMLKLEKEGDAKTLEPYMQSLVLPNPNAWFKTVFGDSIGGTLSDSYERTSIELPISFSDTLANLIKQGVSNPEAIHFTDSCNSVASPHEYPILILRRNSQPLYDVRFVKGDKLLTIAYFAYVDSAFRYTANFQVSGSWPIGTNANPVKPAGKLPERIRLNGEVQAARLIRQVMPDYPSQARNAHIQGTVLFHALIAEDGTIRDLQLIQGQCWLAEAAIKAVSQWRYKPMLLNGEPVAVDTTIQVIFNIR